MDSLSVLLVAFATLAALTTRVGPLASAFGRKYWCCKMKFWGQHVTGWLNIATETLQEGFVWCSVGPVSRADFDFSIALSNLMDCREELPMICAGSWPRDLQFEAIDLAQFSILVGMVLWPCYWWLRTVATSYIVPKAPAGGTQDPLLAPHLWCVCWLPMATVRKLDWCL